MIAVKIVDGLPYPAYFEKENYFLMKNLQLRENDVILSTFPKCGTNWTAYIIWSILHPDEPAPEPRRVQNDVPFVEFRGLGSWQGSPEDQGRTLLTHLPADRLQKSADAKYIVVIRNPLDCCVSFYHFWKNLPHAREYAKDLDTFDKEFTPEVFLDHFLKGETVWGDFFQHLKSWYELKNQDNVQFIYFEKLKTKPTEEILRLAHFLGHGEKLKASNGKLLDKVVEQSSFAVMKNNLQYTCPVDKKPLPLLRKGDIGSYRDTLNPRQIEVLKNKMEQELAGTEILQFWRDL